MPTLRQQPGKLIELTWTTRGADGRREYPRKMSTLLEEETRDGQARSRITNRTEKLRQRG
jgi:hypothetical protein